MMLIGKRPARGCDRVENSVALRREEMAETAAVAERVAIPRDGDNDYTHEMAARRRDFVAERTGADLSHVALYSFDPSTLPGNIENFFGVAQVPIGIAGPLLVHGEHARGEYYVPLATTEGTLVASYNRGMRVLAACGGAKTTVVEEYMQRAPVFVFRDAMEARDFGKWVNENLTAITQAAEATTRVGKLSHINQFQIGPLRYLRFNFSTGDAAGQNMVGKAVWAACEFIKNAYPGQLSYFLSGNVDTDKKHSQMNMLLTRGKRVVAEAVINRQTLLDVTGADVKELFQLRQIQNAGSFLAASASVAAHPANGLAALFIATGQDVANIAESHAAITYSQLLESGDYYWTITLPSLIVATYGGGTGLATQRQCLEMLGCYGAGKVQKFAEICAAVVLAGELSLASAVLHGDWVAAHEKLGRNRP
jgi:hydroxymethylglutaryl-CoA reductase (NADPH)